MPVMEKCRLECAPLFRPISGPCSHIYSGCTRFDANDSPPAIVHSVARIVTNRVLRTELIPNLLVDPAQVFKAFYRENAAAGSLRKQTQLAPRDFIKPLVDRTNQIWRKRLSRHRSLRRVWIVFCEVAIKLTKREVKIVGIGFGL